MAVAPEPYLSACLEVLTFATLEARFWGWTNDVSPQKLADMMHAVHNIPHLLHEWEKCDVAWLRAMLAEYGEKWRDSGGMVLLNKFDEIVARANQSAQ